MAEYVDFVDGTNQNARVTFTNPKSQAISYSGTFYLAKSTDLTTPMNTPVSNEFTVLAQGTKQVDYSVPIPFLTVQSAEYVACLAISVSGTPIVTFVGTKIVRVTFTPGIGWGDIIWNP